MPRGFVWANYVSDDGVTYALRVDADYALDASRGWATPVASGTPVYPRGWAARRVIGVDVDGRVRSALVGDVSASLWTGTADVFLVEGTDQLVHEYTVIRHKAEQLRAKPP